MSVLFLFTNIISLLRNFSGILNKTTLKSHVCMFHLVVSSVKFKFMFKTDIDVNALIAYGILPGLIKDIQKWVLLISRTLSNL